VGVSKEMARFRREGLIEPRGRGRIVLVDRPKAVVNDIGPPLRCLLLSVAL
jgi:hypothetical protein